MDTLSFCFFTLFHHLFFQIVLAYILFLLFMLVFGQWYYYYLVLSFIQGFLRYLVSLGYQVIHKSRTKRADWEFSQEWSFHLWIHSEICAVVEVSVEGDQKSLQDNCFTGNHYSFYGQRDSNFLRQERKGCFYWPRMLGRI